MRAGKAGLGLILLALLCQFALQAWFFPLGEVFSATPLMHTDNALHLYRAEVFRALCSKGQILGYDPYFGAGQLGGLTYSSSAKLQALLACALPGDNAAAVALKFMSFVLSLLAVLAVPATAALLRLSAPVAGLATLFGFILWWATPMRWFHTVGMSSFVTAACLALPYSVWLQRLASAPVVPAGRWLMALVLAGLGSVLHALFIVCVTWMLLGLAIACRRNRRALGRLALCLPALAGSSLLFNAPWFYDAWRLQGGWLRGEQPFQRIVDPLLPFKEALMLAPTPGAGSFFYAVLLVGCVCLVLLPRWRATETSAVGLPAEARTKTAALWALALAGSLLLVFAAVGAAHPRLGNLLQPNRFVLPGWLCLALPAAAGMVGLGQSLWLNWRAKAANTGVGVPGLLAVGLLMFASAGTLFFVREMALEVHGAAGPRHGVSRPEVKPIGELSQALVRTLKPQGKDDDGRVLFELSGAGVYDRAHNSGILARWTQREFIGGPYPYFHHASLEDGVWLGQPLGQFSVEALVASLDLFNVTSIVCHSVVCHERLGALPAVSRVDKWGAVAVYRRSVASSYVLSGEGRVTARAVNHVEVQALPGHELVLKYHWVPGLQSDPPQALEPRAVPGQPQPFIAAPSPPAKFVLFVR